MKDDDPASLHEEDIPGFDLDDDLDFLKSPPPPWPYEAEPEGDKLNQRERAAVAEKVNALPVYSPKEIERRLVNLGYRGQEYARRAGAVLAYRHLQRLRRDFVENVPARDLAPRENYLFLGATGTGKTLLVELLFQHILKVPTVIADMTRFSETGYVGDDVQTLLSQLYELAGQDRAWASCGVACLDEFDKLAASRSSARFAGQGTTKDVSGFGVQRGLLTLLSGISSPFPGDFGFSGHGARYTMPLRNLVFVACGAFSGLKEAAMLSLRENYIGFNAPPRPESSDALVAKIGSELIENTRAFSDYGILPELMGRFSRVVPFQPLGDDILRQILKDNVVGAYQREFAAEGVDLIVTDAAARHVIEGATRRETGARGLRASLVPLLEEAAFETFGLTGRRRAVLGVKKGELDLRIEKP